MFAFLHLPWMLFGLAALALPVLVHLLNRRRFDVVEWGAMRFLKVSETTRKRILLDEVLLMLLRMALLAALVVGLAGPFVDVKLPRALAGRTPRDVVLVIDGSASMGATADDPPPAERAKEWARKLLDELSPGDGVAVVLAREQPVGVVNELSPEHGRVRRLIGELPPPSGSCDVADALRRAAALLAPSQKRRREVIFLTDGQKAGLADANSLFRLEMLAGEMGPAAERPRLWAVDLAPGRKAALPNGALSPLRCNRPVVPVDREVTFGSDIVLTNQPPVPAVLRLRLEIDGKPVRDLAAPAAGPTEGRVPFSFTHRFRAVGSHLVSVMLDAGGDRDRVPGDNRQDFAVEVVDAVPVLIVDGGEGSRFLRDALSPARDTHPVVKTAVVGVNDFAPPITARAVILHDVARLRPEQNDALTAFVENGGGVLVAPGARAEADFYNGVGWRPARLDGLAGDEAKPRDAARPDPGSFTHPALELFRRSAVGGLGDARFPRWWTLTTPGQHAAGSPVGLLQTSAGKTPFLVERAFGAGRVLLCAVPMDAAWGSNLPDLPAFVPLAHELVYYLAGARASDFNLAAGQPIRHRIGGDLGGWTLRPPGGEALPLSLAPGQPGTRLVQRTAAGPVVYDGARASGVYTLRSPDGVPWYFVVPADAAEGDLTPLSDDDRQKLTKVLGVEFGGDGALAADGDDADRQELWLYLLLGVVGLLCVEVWMTRRLVRSR